MTPLVTQKVVTPECLNIKAGDKAHERMQIFDASILHENKYLFELINNVGMYFVFVDFIDV